VRINGDEGAANAFRCEIGHDRFLGVVRRFDALVKGCTILGETNFRGDIAVVSIPPEAVQLLPADPKQVANKGEQR
jgi:putative spermidine/putrescine transport system ATP-binding protein